ncbi:hypothetical protein P5E93_14970 [Clostridium perfringens]|nr:hypothetical protein [Clostridium perfringens]
MYILTENQKVYADFISFERIGKSVYGITRQNAKYRIKKFEDIDVAKKFMADIFLHDRLDRDIFNGYLDDIDGYIKREEKKYKENMSRTLRDIKKEKLNKVK